MLNFKGLPDSTRFIASRFSLLDDAHLRDGLNVYAGKVTCREVAEYLGYEYVGAETALRQ